MTGQHRFSAGPFLRKHWGERYRVCVPWSCSYCLLSTPCIGPSLPHPAQGAQGAAWPQFPRYPTRDQVPAGDPRRLRSTKGKGELPRPLPCQQLPCPLAAGHPGSARRPGTDPCCGAPAGFCGTRTPIRDRQGHGRRAPRAARGAGGRRKGGAASTGRGAAQETPAPGRRGGGARAGGARGGAGEPQPVRPAAGRGAAGAAGRALGRAHQRRPGRAVLAAALPAPWRRMPGPARSVGGQRGAVPGGLAPRPRFMEWGDRMAGGFGWLVWVRRRCPRPVERRHTLATMRWARA